MGIVWYGIRWKGSTLPNSRIFKGKDGAESACRFFEKMYGNQDKMEVICLADYTLRQIVEWFPSMPHNFYRDVACKRN